MFIRSVRSLHFDVKAWWVPATFEDRGFAAVKVFRLMTVLLLLNALGCIDATAEPVSISLVKLPPAVRVSDPLEFELAIINRSGRPVVFNRNAIGIERTLFLRASESDPRPNLRSVTVTGSSVFPFPSEGDGNAEITIQPASIYTMHFKSGLWKWAIVLSSDEMPSVTNSKLVGAALIFNDEVGGVARSQRTILSPLQRIDFDSK